MKDILIGILFLWAKENPDISYKQGMYEILAIVVFAFFAERVTPKKDYEFIDDHSIATNPDDLVSFIFDSKHTFADIYSTYNCILQYGVKNLYAETKDISVLRKELVINIFCYTDWL